MSLIKWNDYFVTGVEVMDDQHRWLIDMINKAAPVLILPYEDSRHAADELLDKLVEYAVFHFRTEADLMAELAVDPRHVEHHSQAHGAFAARVLEMRANYREQGDISGGDLLTFLGNWLVFHILGEDQVLARQLLAIRRGESPGSAFEHAEGEHVDQAQKALTEALIDLYQLMNSQYRDLQEAHHELAQHRNHLEEMVIRRTRQLEEARDAAEAANRAKSAFLANMSHELKTPMNAIVGMAWALRRQVDSPALQEKLEVIERSSEHLKSLIDEVLDLVRIESGELTLEPLDFSLPALLDHLDREARRGAEARQIAYRQERSTNLPAMVFGDPRRIGQIIRHLLDNAIAFTERGSVTLKSSALGEDTGRMRLRFTVEDTGVGISQAHLDRLFSMFEQADASTTRRHGGLGIGLALCSRLAKLMGGTLDATSQPGHGSIFRLELSLRLSGTRLDVPADNTVPGDEKSAADVVATLRDLVREDDIQALRLWHQHAAALSARLGQARAENVARALENYDFQAALAALKD